VVPITADPIGDRDCADGGGGFLSFAFCFFAAICADPECGSGPST
jgi:hypothetical protein